VSSLSFFASAVFVVFVAGRRRRGSEPEEDLPEQSGWILRGSRPRSRSEPAGQGAGSSSAGGAVLFPRFRDFLRRRGQGVTSGEMRVVKKDHREVKCRFKGSVRFRLRLVCKLG
jgi:hypothetical protein